MPGPRLIPFLPTALTLANVVFGFLAVARIIDAMAMSTTGNGVFDPAFTEKMLQACWCIAAAMVCDAFDGRLARMMKVTSDFGAQLDSLADMVTFGMAPALLAKAMYGHTMAELGVKSHPGLVTLLCSLYLMGAAMRLARFNVSTEPDESAHDTFLGLPSPAAAFTVVSLCLFVLVGRSEVGLSPEAADKLGAILLRALPGVAAALGLLMISHVRYVHLFQRYVKSRTRAATFVRMVLAVWIGWFFWEWALFVASLVYVLGGLLLWAIARSRGKPVLATLPPPWDPDDEDEVPP